MPRSVKDSNPKEGIGATRIPFHLLPQGPLALVAMAFYEGGLKYGPYNWRFAGVRASTYVAAVMRHITKWFNGHDHDPTSRVHHLANAIAGLMIVLDAEMQGKLNDDRPPKQDLEKVYGELEKVMAHLSGLYGDMNPPNYTEVDYGKEARGEADSGTAGEHLPTPKRIGPDQGGDGGTGYPWDEPRPRTADGLGTAAQGVAGCVNCFPKQNA